jgi:hypoxanthine phosphoribosyltransferase
MIPNRSRQTPFRLPRLALRRAVRSDINPGTAEERAAQLSFEPPDGCLPGQHILVVDDVLNSGTSAAAVMMRVTQWNPLCNVRFSLARALWVVN